MKFHGVVLAFHGEQLEVWSSRMPGCPFCRQLHGNHGGWPRPGAAVSQLKGRSMLVHFGCADIVEEALDSWAAGAFEYDRLRVGEAEFRVRKL